jgi:hypothetical protein
MSIKMFDDIVSHEDKNNAVFALLVGCSGYK